MHPALLVGAGFLLGTAGMKALKSKPAHRFYVKSIACGMKMRDDITKMVDEARMEFDDLMAEASYENALRNCGCEETGFVEEEIIVDEIADEAVPDTSDNAAAADKATGKVAGKTSSKTSPKA